MDKNKLHKLIKTLETENRLIFDIGVDIKRVIEDLEDALSTLHDPCVERKNLELAVGTILMDAAKHLDDASYTLTENHKRLMEL